MTAPMTTVRIAHAEPRPGALGNGGFVTHGFLVVLADDAGQRAMPSWLGTHPGGDSLHELLSRAAGDIVTAGAPEELSARLLHSAGTRVTGVDIEPAAPTGIAAQDASGAGTPAGGPDPAAGGPDPAGGPDTAAGGRLSGAPGHITASVAKFRYRATSGHGSLSGP
jgi:hypothetical protein